MSIYVNANHPTFQLPDHIYKVTQSFLDSFGFNYFQYLRCYKDGSIGLLSTTVTLLQRALAQEDQPVSYSSFSPNHESMHSYWFFWNEEVPPDAQELAKEFQFYNGVTLVRRTPNYYDMIAFARSEPIENQGVFYLNNRRAIEAFIHSFDVQHKDLITIMDQNKISIPQVQRDLNYQKMCLPSKRVIVQSANQIQTYVTSQELICLRLLANNSSHKEIGYVLEISPRSVQTYLRRASERTGYSSFQLTTQLFR